MGSERYIVTRTSRYSAEADEPPCEKLSWEDVDRLQRAFGTEEDWDAAHPQDPWRDRGSGHGTEEDTHPDTGEVRHYITRMVREKAWVWHGPLFALLDWVDSHEFVLSKPSPYMGPRLWQVEIYDDYRE